MKTFQLWAPRIQLGLGLALGTMALCLLPGGLAAGEETVPKTDVPPAKQSASSAKKAEKKPRKKFNGAELYALHCNRCHPERYAAERTADQWKTILAHMRTRANLPAEEARAILEYLQEESGK